VQYQTNRRGNGGDAVTSECVVLVAVLVALTDEEVGGSV